MNHFPCLLRSSLPWGEARFALGDPLVDSYLEFDRSGLGWPILPDERTG